MVLVFTLATGVTTGAGIVGAGVFILDVSTGLVGFGCTLGVDACVFVGAFALILSSCSPDGVAAALLNGTGTTGTGAVLSIGLGVTGVVGASDCLTTLGTGCGIGVELVLVFTLGVCVSTLGVSLTVA